MEAEVSDHVWGLEEVVGLLKRWTRRIGFVPGSNGFFLGIEQQVLLAGA